MTLNNSDPGFNFVPAYTAPGLPWVSSGALATTTTRFDFPFVTKSIVVANNSAVGTLMRVGFTYEGINGTTPGTRYFLLDGKQSITLDVRVRELYLQGDAGAVNYALCANLTSIQSRMMAPLSGSGNASSGSLNWNGV